MPRVSIHAPVKGRPDGNDIVLSPDWVSIHAPVKGRPAAYERYDTMKWFQSTPP